MNQSINQSRHFLGKPQGIRNRASPCGVEFRPQSTRNNILNKLLNQDASLGERESLSNSVPPYGASFSSQIAPHHSLETIYILDLVTVSTRLKVDDSAYYTTSSIYVHPTLKTTRVIIDRPIIMNYELTIQETWVSINVAKCFPTPLILRKPPMDMVKYPPTPPC